MAGPSVLVRFLADTKAFQQAVGQVEGSTDGFTSKLKTVAAAIGTAFVAKKVVDFAKESIAAAQDLNANMSRTNTIFGEASSAVVDWSKTSASSMRISQADALGAANAIGKTLVGSMGMGEKAAAEMSTGVVQMARDFAAFNRIPFDEALGKVQKGLTGSTRGMRDLGIVMSTAEVEAKAVSMGLAKTTVDMSKVEAATRKVESAQLTYNAAVKKFGPDSTQAKKAALGLESAQQGVDKAMAGGKTTMDAAAKAQASYALMLEKGQMQMGATQKGAGSLRGQQERLSAEWKNAQATVGNALLPALTDLMKVVSSLLLPAISALSSVFRALGPAMTPIVAAIIALAAGIKIATIAQNLFNISLLANPITWIVIGIVALVAAILVLATKTQFFQKIWQAVWGAVSSTVSSVVNAVKTAFNAVVNAITGAVNWVLNFVRNNWQLIVGILGGPIAAAVVLIITHWNTIRNAFSSAINFVLAVWRTGWNAIRAVVTGIVGGVVGAVNGLVGGVRGAISAVTEILAAPFRAAAAAISAIVGGIRSTVEGVINGVKSVVNTGLAPLRSLLSAIGSVGFDIKTPDWIPGIGGKGWSFRFPDFSGRIPHLQTGGVISWPTLALLGERPGVREVVAPEPLLREIVRDEGTHGPLLKIEHFHAEGEADIDLLLRRVSWAAATGTI